MEGSTGRRPNPRRLARAAAGGIVVMTLSACVDIVAQNAPGALRTAESRAKFELNCPQVDSSVLSQKIVQGLRFAGSEHTIGVRGCGKQVVYVTYCRDSDDCNAIAQTDRVEAAPPDVPVR